MLKRRFILYIVGICIIAFLSVSYVAYRAYQNHVEFKAAMSNAQAFNRPIEHDKAHEHSHAAGGHTHREKNTPPPAVERSSSGLSFFKGKQGDEYVYEINGFPVYSNMPLSQEQIEWHEWIHTGKMTPAVEKQFRMREDLKSYVVQRVVDPDGKMYTVTVPRNLQYEEGDAILQSELSPMIPLETSQMEVSQNRKPLREGTLIRDGVEYSPPEEFDSIEDPYERREFLKKYAWSIEHKVAMVDVEKKVVQRELDFSLSEAEKRNVDEAEARKERARLLLSSSSIPQSDKPPVKISFLPDEGEGALPGWVRKGQGHPSGSGKTESSGSPPAADSVSERGSDEDVSGAPVPSDLPISPSDPPDMVKPTPSPLNVADLEKLLTPEGIEAELSEGVSPERFNKAQQLIDQYGTEEGLRRLRESDSEAARQFEREQHKPKMNTEP
jgi:hypothetical protein